MAIGHSSAAWSGQALSRDGGRLAGFDPRLKLALAVGFALAAVLVQGTVIKAGFALGGVGLCLLAGIPRARLVRRIAALEGFMVLMVVLLPFTVPGPTLFSVFGLHASWTGLQHGVDILLAATAVLCGLMALVGSLPANVLGQTLASLGVPERLVALLMLTVRYLDVVGGEYRRMRNSMRARAFVAGTNRHTWRSVGHLVGMGLLRSIDRAERVTDAMRCRGFDGRYPILYPFRWRQHDSLAALCAGLVLTGVVMWSMR